LAVLAFAAVLGGVILFGGARLTLYPPSATTVRIAGLSRTMVGAEPSPGAWERMLQDRPTRTDVEEIGQSAAAVAADQLARTEREARAGAKIIFWGEGDGKVLKGQESRLIDDGRALARKYQIYLGMALGTWNRGLPKPLENKIVLITPSGDVAWQHYKTHPVPGGEADISMVDDGRLPILQTPYGRLTSAICFDADFPQLIAQAGELRADILLDPAGDWPAIDPLHTWMASFRAIEQGVNLVRQTTDGLSAAYDYQGRVLAAVDYFHSPDHAMIAQVPIQGTDTIYSRIGDLFAWMCLATLPLLALHTMTAPPAKIG
jgi:apolipoprotein N-acyltransferase